jgi:hypothetical protein
MLFGNELQKAGTDCKRFDSVEARPSPLAGAPMSNQAVKGSKGER